MKPAKWMLAAVTLCVTAVTQAAEIYPSRPIRLVVPLPPAGAGDIVARTVATKLSELWGQQVVIDNRGGANTIIGTEIVARAKPDGYTWLLGVQGSLAINPVTYRKLPYDALRDFDPVTQITRYGYVLVVPPSLPVRNTAEFVALAKRRPGEISYGPSGAGGSNHLAGELFRLTAGVSMNAVPYKGSSPALTALLSGEITCMFDTLITSIPLVRSGRLKALGVTLDKRSPSLPAVPTIAESGVPGFAFSTWTGLFAPRGTPKPVVDKLAAEVVSALKDPVLRMKLQSMGGNPESSTPGELADRIRQITAKMRKVIQDAGISGE